MKTGVQLWLYSGVQLWLYSGVQLWLYSGELFVELNIFLTEDIEKNKIHFLCSKSLLKNHTIYEKMWKNIVKIGEKWHNVAHGLCVLDSFGKDRDRLCNVYCLCMATCYMFVPQHYVTCTLPVLVCWSLAVRTAADNSKIKLQAVAPCAVRTAICVVAMKG